MTDTPAETKRKRPKLPAGLMVAILVVAAFAALIVYRALEASEPAPADPTVEELRQQQGIPVVVETADVGSIAVWERFHGTVSGAREAVVRARTDNPVARVRVSVGDQVRVGQVLVELSGETIEARRRQAETAYQQAKRRMERLEALHEAGALSDQEWEEAVSAYEMARDDLAAAREALVLESPLAGTVTEVAARPGMVPSPGDPLVRVADLSQRVVRLQVSASSARALEAGQPARLADREAEGSVSRVALHADPATRLVEVEITFPPDAPLFPGTLETVEVLTARRDEALRVPRAALRDDGVWVVDEDETAAHRQVTTGMRDEEMVEITSGLDEGDRVVVQGASALREGATVRIVDATDEAA